VAFLWRRWWDASRIGKGALGCGFYLKAGVASRHHGGWS
jgi:hypothetical protein